MDEVETLVPRWLRLDEVAAALAMTKPQVRRLLQDRHLVGIRRGSPVGLAVPAAFVEPELLPGLAGTLTVLLDGGFSEAEAIRWLFSPQDGLAGPPVEELRAGHKGEIRRRAQVLAL